MKLDHIDPKLLMANPWNTNVVTPENEEKLEASIDRLSMFKPVIVRTLEDGTMQILGGEHRAEVALNKGMATIPVINLGLVDDIKAKEISIVDNGRYGADDTLKLADLLDEIGGADVVASFTPFSSAELDAIFSSSSIDLDDLSLDDEDEEPALDDTPTKPMTATHQIMRFKVPVEDADTLIDLIEHVMKYQRFDSADALTNAGDALVFVAGEYKKQLTSES